MSVWWYMEQPPEPAMFIDFQALKAEVSIVDVAELLALRLTEHQNQRRGPCPRCKEGGDRTLVITPEKEVFYCFSAKQGGDCIALVAHIRDLSMKDAAHYIIEHIGAEPDTEPEAPEAEPPQEPHEGKALQPLAYLHYEHEAVQSLGIDAETAKSVGIGYAKKGMMRGRVAIPIRKKDGTLVGYCGYAEGTDPVLKFPKNLSA